MRLVAIIFALVLSGRTQTVPYMDCNSWSQEYIADCGNGEPCMVECDYTQCSWVNADGSFGSQIWGTCYYEPMF